MRVAAAQAKLRGGDKKKKAAARSYESAGKKRGEKARGSDNKYQGE